MAKQREVNKNFCMSSYCCFRYIEDESKDFFEETVHKNMPEIPEGKKIIVKTVDDVDAAIQTQFDKLKDKNLGILLSGGMDSAVLAAYLNGDKNGKIRRAYTFRFLEGDFQREELERAEWYAAYNNLDLSYVDINWETVEKHVDVLMKFRGAPVHSIEPQLMQAALQAKKDGIECMIHGDSADPLFGGMDGLLAKDWGFDEFVERYTFLQPQKVLKYPVPMNYLFERYRKGEMIDFELFMDEVYSSESSSSYWSAFSAAGIEYVDPYEKLKRGFPLDLKRIRNGESKYIIRELFMRKYHILAPNKNPMPRPVDFYFRDWEGPKRQEFREDIDMNSLTGNQKWQLWCLERFLNLFDK